MHQQNPKKYILLNAGTRTRHAFIEGLEGAPLEHYRTKEILLHITPTEEPKFIHSNHTILWDDAYVFTRLRGTDQHFCGMLYDYFLHKNIQVTDPINHSYPYSAEKISQMLLLSLAHIRIPETFIFREESFAKNREYIDSHIQYPLIFKTDGSKGRNVHYVQNSTELMQCMERKNPHALALIQPFIENTFDTRTLVAFGDIIGSIKRARTHGHLNNIAQGGTASHYELSEFEKDIAIRATHVCGIDVAGVDIIHTEHGPMVLEVNKSPQVKGFESVHQFKVFSRIASLMRKKYDDETLGIREDLV